ncbi:MULTISPECIES: ATP-binding protein [Methanobacterium]|jgi:NAD-dependent dihydropyrimidine dehydrogenase PreA subunit|uniref:4Fe-4S ferredoxin n=1 Tax=Methanobacterium bryantii TaxID=2161 RepID=A0A2A2H6J6_METBR|nr:MULTISPECIES: 4Fe-4S binding protein [Methanobacterium]OEC84588.1 4Fe-4S ferredoxin [Methanobacterium sp. A39]PAV04890.1 4Fe-4S ferredoxin [Methanobacterium bryantii]
MKRDVIKINEEKCTGCGECIPGCPEGALQVIEGKARLISDLFCDGLGACIGNCPQGAIEIEQREAEPYDENKVMKNIIRGGPSVIMAHLKHLSDHGQKDLLNQAVDFLKERNIDIPDYEKGASFECACPGSMAVDLNQKPETENEPQIRVSPELRNWPVQLQLLNPNAPYFKNADLLISADCAPFAYANFHQEFLKDKVLIILCPKLDKTIDMYVDKLVEIFEKQDVNSISIVHMEVPCCSGIEVIVRRALEKVQKDIPLKDYTISISGEIIQAK